MMQRASAKRTTAFLLLIGQINVNAVKKVKKVG
jgi:hypothetical protein